LTLSGVKLNGEFPKSAKSRTFPSLSAARIKPASLTFLASSTVPTGIIFSAPAAKAAQIDDVALKTSITTTLEFEL